jgi:Fe-S cluster assembly protein SufD
VTLTTLEQALRPGGAPLPGSADSLPWREAARSEAATAGVPTPRRESWRYTDLKSLADRSFELPPRAPDAAALQAAERAIDGCDLDADAAKIVLVDGHPAPSLGRLTPGSGCAIETRSGGNGLGRPTYSSADHPLAALNTAFAHAQTTLRVADGVKVAQPVHVLVVASGAPDLAAQPRLGIELGHGAELTVIHHFVDAGEPTGWVNSVTEVRQAPQSRLTLQRVQQHASTHSHTSLLTIDLAEYASASIGLVDLGGRLVRNDVDVKLRERGSAVELFGVFLAGEGQHIDNHTRFDHLAPETRSDESVRGIVGHRGRGVFNGKVVVHRDAQRIDARQSNDNLLLSDQAEIDTKPELEIYADDVKCSHGATVGELDTEHLFYLRARGVDEQTAREILTAAFAAAALERIANPALREKITARVAARLGALTETKR